MGFGGRPSTEGGHDRVRVSLNAEVRGCLNKLKERGAIRSHFVEQALTGPCRELDDDPRPGCKDVSDIKKMVDDRLALAVQRKDYERVQVLSIIGKTIQPLAALCEFKSSPSAPSKERAERPAMIFFRPKNGRSKQA